MEVIVDSNIILTIKNLKGGYKTEYGYFRAVDGIDLNVLQREIVGIVGESGSGKTTLLKLIVSGGRFPPLLLEDGKIIIENIDVSSLELDELKKRVLGKKIAYVPQAAYDAIYPYKKIWYFYRDMLEELGTSISKEKESEIKQYLIEFFESMGLEPSIIDRYSFELSGGMRQRAVIALVTSLKPSILLLDEPTSALDVVTQRKVLSMIADVFKREYVKSIIISSHDIATLRQIVHRLAVMYAGKLMEASKTEDIISTPLHPYTKLLMVSLEAFDKFASRKEYRAKIPFKDLISMYSLQAIKGCRFHPRCPYAMDICRREEPPMIEVEKGHFIACWLHMKR